MIHIPTYHHRQWTKERFRQICLSFLTTLLFLLPLAASAQTPPPVNCGILPGCTGGFSSIPASNILTTISIPVVATVLLNIAAGLSVIFVIVGGVIYVASQGEEEKLTKGKNTIVAALGGLVLALSSHKIVAMVATQNWGFGAGNFVLQGLFPAVVSIILTVFNAAFLLMIILGGMRFIVARGQEDSLNKARKMVFYAVVGALIVNIARILVQIILGLQLS